MNWAKSPQLPEEHVKQPISPGPLVKPCMTVITILGNLRKTSTMQSEPSRKVCPGPNDCLSLENLECPAWLFSVRQSIAGCSSCLSLILFFLFFSHRVFLPSPLNRFRLFAGHHRTILVAPLHFARLIQHKNCKCFVPGI